MVSKFFEGVVAFLNKIQTIIFDRRLAVTIIAVLGLLQLFNIDIDFSEADVEAGFGNIGLILDGIAGLVIILVPLWKLLDSWTARAPSGLAPFFVKKDGK